MRWVYQLTNDTFHIQPVSYMVHIFAWHPGEPIAKEHGWDEGKASRAVPPSAAERKRMPRVSEDLRQREEVGLQDVLRDPKPKVAR